MSSAVDREELFSGGIAGTSNSLLRLAGGWGNIGGPGMFMIRSITSGAITSIFTGMCGAIISAFMYGTASLPFVVCSCAGFVIGSIGFYRDSVRKSLLYLDRFPHLLQLHMDANFPAYGFNTWPIERLHSSNFRSWQMRSMLMVGWLSALPAIENIIEANEQSLIEDASASKASKSSITQ